MKYSRYMLAVLLLMLFIPVAFSQNEVIVLTHEELGSHERPPVRFNHERHQEVVTECARCHHNYDEHMNNIGGEGQTCSECHSKSKGDNVIPLMKAFHLQCKSCHEELLSRGKKSGPIICGQCHQK